MKRNIAINKIFVATLIASSFVACNDDDETSSYFSPYNANLSSIASVGTAVDLGLRSGTKWADKNVGAASAKDNGVSFIWGDVTGTVTSISENTYTQGTSADMQTYFEKFQGPDVTSEYDTVQVAKLDYIVEAADSIRPNFSYDIIIKRIAQVKVKDADGNFVMDGDEYVREEKVYTEVDDRILMGHEGLTAYNNKVAFLKPYKEDKYNKYVIEKCDSVYWTDVVKKLVPAEGQTPIEDVLADVKKSTGNDEAWYYFTDGVYNEKDSYLHAYLIVETRNVTKYVKKADGNSEIVPVLTIIGDAKFDAATKNWGADWAMPTKAQLEELINECTWEFDGSGYIVTGPNKKSIFLPAAGYRYEANLIGVGGAGYYASGEVYGKYNYPSGKEQMAGSFGTATANSMPEVMVFNAGQFDNSKKMMNSFVDQNIGLSIRPVSKK